MNLCPVKNPAEHGVRDLGMKGDRCVSWRDGYTFDDAGNATMKRLPYMLPHGMTRDDYRVYYEAFDAACEEFGGGYSVERDTWAHNRAVEVLCGTWRDAS